jgi:hypothetical protein
MGAIKKIPLSNATRLYRQAWRHFDYGLITKDELIEKLNEINSK